MTRIDQQFADIEANKHENGAIKFFSNAEKKKREWQVLGAIQRQLLAASREAPVFAIERESPDFATYTENRNPWFYVEVVEVLRRDYRRHDFHREQAKPDAPRFFPVDPPLSDPFGPLREEISKKAQKNYPSPVLLAVYYDIARTSFNDWAKPFHDHLLDEHSRKPFADLSRFDRVLILNCDMRGLVELHPKPAVIVPDDPFAS